MSGEVTLTVDCVAFVRAVDRARDIGAKILRGVYGQPLRGKTRPPRRYVKAFRRMERAFRTAMAVEVIPEPLR